MSERRRGGINAEPPFLDATQGLLLGRQARVGQRHCPDVAMLSPQGDAKEDQAAAAA